MVDEYDVKQPRLNYPHAFKLLAPDALSGAIIGAKGAGVQEIQQKTDTRVSVADRNGKYSATNSRIVLIRAQTSDAIDQAILEILTKLKSCVESPRKFQDDSELVGKSGEYRLKIVVPKAAAGAVIGTKGVNIKKLSEETGCRVRVEDPKGAPSDRCAEQVVALLGSLDSVSASALKVNAYVQECASHAYFQEWAHLSMSTGKGKGDHVSQGGYSASLSGLSYTGASMYNNGDDMLVRTLRQMPRHLTDSQTFALQASLPIDAMSGLIGRGGSGTKDVNLQTGAKVTLRDDEPNCTVMIEGSLNGTLSAYMLMMKRYLELEQNGLPEKSKGKGKR